MAESKPLENKNQYYYFSERRMHYRYLIVMLA